MRISVLGNGPSLKNLSLKDICKSSDVIIGCNRIYLHEEFKFLKNEILVAFTDLSFRSIRDEVNKKVLKKNSLFAADIELNNEGKSFEIIRGTNFKGDSDFAVSNIKKFPKLFEMSSVISTLVMPYAFSLRPKYINIYGVDMKYYINGKFQPYFYNKDINKSYNWDVNQAKKWSDQFSKEIKSQTNYIFRKGIKIK